MRAITLILSMALWLIAATMTRTLRGFGWQLHKAGDPVWQTSNGSGWAEVGELPTEWEQIKQDPSIDAAKLYTSAQAQRRADKRRVLDQKGGAA